ncbi:MAG: DUF2024 family protein [Nitrospiraceae bacterium]
MMDAVKVFDTWVEIKGKMLHFDVMTNEGHIGLPTNMWRAWGIDDLRSRRRNVSSAIRNHW